MAIQCGLADLPVLIPSSAQFVIGGVLEPEQGVVGAGHSQQDLIELALSRPLVARLGVLDDEDHGERERGHHGLEDGLPPRGKPDSDADGDPHCGRGDDEHRGERPGCMPVYPRQPPADMRPLRGWS
jgi:hypothetical protein